MCATGFASARSCPAGGAKALAKRGLGGTQGGWAPETFRRAGGEDKRRRHPLIA